MSRLHVIASLVMLFCLGTALGVRLSGRPYVILAAWAMMGIGAVVHIALYAREGKL